MVAFAKRGVEGVPHLLRSAGPGPFERVGFIADGLRLQAFDARFDQAAFVVRAGLGRVLVTELHFDARNVPAVAVETGFNISCDVGGKFFAAFDDFVGI